MERLPLEVVALIAPEVDRVLALTSTSKRFAGLKGILRRLVIEYPRDADVSLLAWWSLGGFHRVVFAEVRLVGVPGRVLSAMFSKEAMTAACRHLAALETLRLPRHGAYATADYARAPTSHVNAYACAVSEHVCHLSRTGILRPEVLVQHPVPRMVGKDSASHDDERRNRSGAFAIVDDMERYTLLLFYPRHRLASFLLHSGAVWREDPEKEGQAMRALKRLPPQNEEVLAILRDLFRKDPVAAGSVGFVDRLGLDCGAAPCGFDARDVSALCQAVGGAAACLASREPLYWNGVLQPDLRWGALSQRRMLVALVESGARFARGEKRALLAALRGTDDAARVAWAQNLVRRFRCNAKRRPVTFEACIRFVESVPDETDPPV